VKESILLSLRGGLFDRVALDNLPEGVWKRAGALNTWGTNAIEGNTLTWRDVERLLLEERSVSNRPVPDVLETIQHERIFRELLDMRKKPVNLVTVLNLHEGVFRGVKADAGQWRRVNVRIAGSKHIPPRMERVVQSMENWIKEYGARDIGGENVFSLGAWMHHRFESIHPFADGNGRVGRLLLNLHFLRHNWPPLHVLPPDRKTYIGHMEEAHDGDLSGLTEFFGVLMSRSLLDLLDQVGTDDDELRPLRRFEKATGHTAKYLSLRAGQGVLPAVKVAGDWYTSLIALKLYNQEVGRG